MKKTVSAFCAVIAAVVILTTLCIFAGVENGEAVIALDTVSGMPGQQVTVNMTLTENPGITGLRFFVKYDASKLEIVSAKYTKLGGGGLTAVNIKNNPFVVLWNVSTYEFTETGVLCTFVFNIKEGAEAGPTSIGVTYGRGDCIDFNLKNLDMDITNGSVNILYDGTNCDHAQTEQKVVSASDCKTAGEYHNVCKKCGSTVSTGALPLKEHSYGALIVTRVPTYDEVGLKEAVCSVCGDVRTEVIDKLIRQESTTTTVVTTEPPSSATGSIDSSDGPATDTQSTAEDSTVSDSVVDTSQVPPETSPQTGDETVVFIIVAVLALALLILVIILKIKRNIK